MVKKNICRRISLAATNLTTNPFHEEKIHQNFCFVCLLGCIIPLKNFPPIWRRDHYR